MKGMAWKGLMMVREAESNGYCESGCVWWWVQKYMKDCLCNSTDKLSFCFGFISLLAWGVAEIPQILTNFRTKSTHGVSLLFLLTWVFGDIFNLAGCVLEPATLPTQYYTALMYTVSTLLLLFQSLYYDHFYTCRLSINQNPNQITHTDKDEENKPMNPKDDSGDGGIPIPRCPPTFYFTSARSMAGSSTPPFRSYLTPPTSKAKSGPSTLALLHDHRQYSSDEDENDDENTRSKPLPIPPSVKRGVVVAASASLPMHANAMASIYTGGRKLLHVGGSESHSGALGQCLGWMMAAIYMGGRIPQIVLNIQRGSVEGLNPLMFVFALIANITYVASILVRSTEWKKIQANMPWLLDAVVCVALDFFIIMQYVYYKYLRKTESHKEEPKESSYMEAEAKEFKYNSS